MSNLTPIRELIETLWNVNDDANVNDVVKIRINRNIVECKCDYIFFKSSEMSELIETLWNVNMSCN